MSTTKKTQKPPKNLLEAIQYFADPEVANDFLAKLRWPQGPVCPDCGCLEHSYLKTRRLWKCKGCKRQYSVKVGTIFEASPLSLSKWLPAVWLIANSKNGISSHELGRALGVTQKSAWFMLHRIRLAMQTGTFQKLDGAIEVDETFIGGKARNMHKSVKAKRALGTGGMGKVPIVGIRQRGGEMRATVVPDVKRPTLHGLIHENVMPGSALYTDQMHSYIGLHEHYAHEVIDHAERYVDGHVHTNTLENFWALLKRGLNGTYVSVKPFHLYRYLDERLFTYNRFDSTDSARFEAVLRAAAGRRLTFAEVTGHV